MPLDVLRDALLPGMTVRAPALPVSGTVCGPYRAAGSLSGPGIWSLPAGRHGRNAWPAVPASMLPTAARHQKATPKGGLSASTRGLRPSLIFVGKTHRQEKRDAGKERPGATLKRLPSPGALP